MKRLLTVLLAVLLAVMVPTSTSVAAASPLWFGVLQANSSQATALKGAKVTTVTLEIGWDQFEPQANTVNLTYVQQQKAKALAWQRAGFQVVLDTGLQYPPAWAFSLPGGTRLVNQWGQSWTGPTSGARVINGVFNSSVRAAEARYYGLLRTHFAGVSFSAVRVGGLHMGELSYPPGSKPGTLWMYDASAQASSPIKGWKPGTGTTADAKKAGDYYLASINSYTKWLLGVTSSNFPQAKMHLLLPSWGIRPTQYDAAVAAGLRGTTSAEINNLIAEGLDWKFQVSLLVPYGSRGVAYTTWIDAPHYGSSLQDMNPAKYLQSLTTGKGIGLAGENTGNGTLESLQVSLNRAKYYGMEGLMWMHSTNLLASPAMMQACATR